nr:helitron helicase-like domain-containing protein [Mycobacterium sp. 852002-51163_SCH5372311]
MPDPPGRTITEWSRKSRAAMCRTFAELDYTPLVESGRVPAMVTLTYPGDWQSVAPDGASVKRHMVLWRKRFQREFGEPARYIWKLEFQRRGAPHIHLWMTPPHAVGRSGSKFRDWLSQEWADIVGHPDAEQRARHTLAGTAIDILNGLRACDPKRLAIYFTKHSSPNHLGDKEYQHIVPEAWRRPGHGPGRFWGVHGLQRGTAVVEIAQDVYLTGRRIIRRWSRSQAAYGDCTRRFPTAIVPRMARVAVRRVDNQTGKVRHRKARRRRLLCDQGGLAGGYVLVGDGPAFASQLAAAIDKLGIV